MDPYLKFLAQRMADSAPGTYARPMQGPAMPTPPVQGPQVPILPPPPSPSQQMAAAAVQAVYGPQQSQVSPLPTLNPQPVRPVAPPYPVPSGPPVPLNVANPAAALATGFGGVVQPPVYATDPYGAGQQAAFHAATGSQGNLAPGSPGFGLGPQTAPVWSPSLPSAPFTGTIMPKTGTASLMPDPSIYGPNTIGDPLVSAGKSALEASLPAIATIDKPRQISVSQMGELIHLAANGGSVPPYLLALPGGAAYWGAITQAVKGDKDKINALYAQGAEMGGGQMLDPATGQMIQTPGQHIDGGRAVYEKYFAAASDNWPIYLRLPFRALFDVVADPLTYALPGATKVGEEAVAKGAAMRGVRAASDLAAKDAATAVLKDAAMTGAEDVGGAVAKTVAEPALPALNPAQPAEAAAKVESVLPSLNPAPAAQAAAKTTIPPAAAKAAVDEIVTTHPWLGAAVQGAGHILMAPQQALDGIAHVLINLPISGIKTLLGDLSEPTAAAIRDRIGLESRTAASEVIKAPDQTAMHEAMSGPVRVATDEHRVPPLAADVAPPIETGAVVPEPTGPVVAPAPKRWTADEIMKEPGNEWMTSGDAGIEAKRRAAVTTKTPLPTLEDVITAGRVETGAATEIGPRVETGAAPAATDVGAVPLATEPAATGPVVAPEVPIGTTPLDQHLTPQAMTDLAQTPEGLPWLREYTPAERTAAIKEGRISTTTPIRNGERIVDRMARDFGESIDPAKRAQYTAFEQEYAPAARQYNREAAIVDATHYADFEQKKAIQAVMEAEHVVNDVVPAYAHATNGELPEIAITRERAVGPNGGKTSFAQEGTEYLVQRAVYSTDPAAAADALHFLETNRWAGTPWRDEMIARLQRARTQVEAIQAAERGPVTRYEVDPGKNTVWAVHGNGDRLKVQGYARRSQAVAEADRLNGVLAPKVEPPTIEPPPTEAPPVDAAAPAATAPESPSSVQPGPMDPSIQPTTPEPVPAAAAPTPAPAEAAPPPAGAEAAAPSTPQTRTLQAVGPKRASTLAADLTPEAAADPTLLGEMARKGDIGAKTYRVMSARVPGMGTTTYYDIFDQLMARHPYDQQATVEEFARFRVNFEGPPIESRSAAGQVWREAAAIPKGIAQYNVFNVHGIVGDALQDGARMVFEGHGAAFASSVNPVTWIKAMLHRPDAYDDLVRELGMAQPFVEGGFHRTGAESGVRSPLSRNLTKLPGLGGKRAQTVVDLLTEPFDSRLLRKARNGLDALRRRAVFVDTVQKGFAPARSRWLEQSSARMEAAGLDASGLENLPDLFTAQQAREAALKAGADPNLAGRIARDWKARLNGLSDAAKTETGRVLFTFEATKADDALANIFYYHYWMTRAYPAYASMAIRHPEFLALWYRTWMASEKQAREGGMPASFTGRLRWFGTAGGFYGSMNPWYVLSVTDPGSISALSSNASLFDKASTMVAFNPAITMAAAVLGASNSVPDPLMSYTIRKYVGTVANFGRAHGWWGEPTLGDAPYQQTLANTVNFARDLLAKAHVPITAKRLTDDPNAYSEDQLAYVARTVVEERSGVPFAQWTQKEWDLWNAANVAIKTQDPSNAIANEAFARWTTAKAENDAGAFVSPGGSRLGYGPRDRGVAASNAGWAAIDAGGQPTPTQQGEMDFKTSAQATGQAAPLIALDNQYGQIGTPWQQDLSSGWGALAYGDTGQLARFFSQSGAKLGASYVQIGGQWLSFSDLAAMTADQRKALADQWVAERSNPTGNVAGTADLNQLRDQQDAFKTANPTYGQYADWKAQARKYPGGEAQWVADARKGNPAYDAYLKTAKNPDKAALSLNGYLAFNGTINNVYGGPTPSVRDMSQVPYNPSEAIGGTGSGSSGPTLSRPDQLKKSISDYNAKWAAVAKYLPNGGKGWDQLVPTVRDAYVAQLKARGITIPSMPARVATYLEWQALQPKGADTSPEAFFAWLDANGSTDPGTALTGVGSGALTPAA